MPATVPTRGVLKASTNRVRTSTALQGNAMWDNIIGISNEQAGSNAGVEALINAPTIGGGRKATQARRQAAADAVMATGGFDSNITNYQSLLAIAKQQGAVGTGARGACKHCGQTGHLSKQCRNLVGGGGADDDEAAAALLAPVAPEGAGADDLELSSDSDSSDEERRRRKRRKDKERKEKRRREKKDRKKQKKEKKSKKEKRSSKEKKRSKDRKRRRSSSGSDSGSSGSGGSGSDSD